MAGAPAVGEQIHAFLSRLYPICRSITGNGVRETLRLLQEQTPLSIHEVPTGTRVFDWTVPKEWNIRDGYVKNSRGERVIDFQKLNLHVVSYSVPVHERMPLGELRKNLHTLPEYPDWVPHKTSYYKETWGFCLSQRQLDALPDGEYEVHIDSSLEDGHLTYGELLLPGATNEEVLISCHVCHPSLGNDNLSGIGVAAWLAKHLSARARRYSYRFLFIPATIGSITWLARNEDQVSRIKHGLVLTCVGDSGSPTYKRSRQGSAEIDNVMEYVLKRSDRPYQLLDFYPYGYDERQYCSPGFDLPVGCLMRTQHGRFAEYHTSADDLRFVKPTALADSLDLCIEAVSVLDHNQRYINNNPKCEPQLGKRGLYRTSGGRPAGPAHELALLWVLNLSDGRHRLLDIAERSGIDFQAIKQAADDLVAHGLLRETAANAVLDKLHLDVSSDA